MRRKIVKINSNAKSKIIILITVGIIFALLPVINNGLNFNAGNSNKSPEYRDNISLDNEKLKLSAVSGKIHIYDNWTATESNYSWCTGSGTWNDPYIIQDLIIDGGGSGFGIYIQFSTEYFKVENCTVYNSEEGINLNFANNGTILGNNLTNNNYGIAISDCKNNTISGNHVSNNINGGISLFYGNNNIISGNTANNNTDFGINLQETDDNIVSGNTFNINTGYGINLMESSNNYIMENTVNNNGNMGINLDPNSTYNEISNNAVNFNGWVGIHMQASSTNNLILSNNCSFNSEGISVRTPNNTISGNYVVNNSEFGIHLWNSDSGPNALSNNITRNFVKYNNYGFLLDPDSALNIIEGNQIIDNTGAGVMILAFCFDNLIYNNTFINNINANAEDYGNNNNWNSTTLGNYWDDYSGVDANDDGIGDTPYDISGTTGSQDNFPIWDDGPEPEIPGIELIILISVISGGAVIGVATILLIRRKRK